MGKLKDAIQKISKTGDEVYSIIAKVKSVDEEERSCVVSPLNGDADIFGVRLQAGLNKEKGIVVFPKVGSYVVVTFLNKITGYIALCTEIEGIYIASNESDFKTEMNSFIDTTIELIGVLRTFQLATNVGATIEVMPHVKLMLEEKETKLEALKSKMNTFLK